MPRFYLWVPNEIELAESLLGLHGTHHQLPPPGMSHGFDPAVLTSMEAGDLGTRRTAFYVEGNPPQGTEDDWWIGTVGDLLISLPDATQGILDRLAVVIARLAGRALVDALSIPLLKRGTAGGDMKWIRTTFRGILGGGVEQFQFHLDLGNPGNDPDLSDVTCLALAEQLAATLTAGSGQLFGSFSGEAAFTEVGCVMMEATAATDKNGLGGNMAQKFPTQWWMWPTGSRPIGTQGTPSLPYEVATAVSLQTDHRGPSGRGRIYLPPPAVQAATAGGIFTVDHVTHALNGAQSLIEAITANTSYVPLVVSPRRLILNTITSVNVGRVPDSQRRRRRSQDEARTSALIAA